MIVRGLDMAERKKGRPSRARPAHAEPLAGVPAGVLISSTGISLPPEFSFDDWMTTCRECGRWSTQNSWALGDLWRYGQKWGEHKKLTEDPGWAGPEYQTCANLAWVAGKFESSRRREELSFRHHAEVAALPADEADALLQWSIDTKATTAELRREIFRRKTTKINVTVAHPRRREPDSTPDSTADLRSAVQLLSAAARRLAIPRPPPAQREPPSAADNPSNTFQLEQPSSGTVLHLLARERRRREPDSLCKVVIGALEHALTTAQSPEDRERYRDALSATREVQHLLFAMIRATPIDRF
jgi:hypothetical protein